MFVKFNGTKVSPKSFFMWVYVTLVAATNGKCVKIVAIFYWELSL